MSQGVLILTGLAAVLGHLWPVTLGFRGGRGVATSVGVLVATLPRPTLFLAPLALSAALIASNTVLATTVFFAPMPFLSLALGSGWSKAGFALLLSLLCFGKDLLDRHSQNRQTKGPAPPASN